MIRYELYDKYGNRVGKHEEPADNCGTVILEHEGQYYRPIHYDLFSTPNIAKCIPVNVIKCRGTRYESLQEQDGQE